VSVVKRWQFWLGIAISVAFLAFGFRGMRPAQVWDVARHANYWWIIPGVIVYFGAVWARTWRWHYMLRAVKAVPLKRLFPVVVIGYMGNNVYPFRAGEVIRAYVLKRKEDVSISASLATIIVERIFDGVTMLFFVFVVLPIVPEAAEWRSIVVWFSLLFFGVLALFFLVAIFPRRSEQILSRLIQRWVPIRFRTQATSVMARFLDGLICLRSGKDVLMIFVTSVVIWLTETTKYWFVMHAFNFRVSFFVLMLMTAVVNLATTIPSSPGYVGTFDAPGIKVLEGFKVPNSVAAGYTLVLHAALWLPITLLGFYYMWRESVSWKEFREAEKLRDKQPESAIDP
jgi:glycosyltransferase 2 family protein